MSDKNEDDAEFCKIAVGEAFGLCGNPEDAFLNVARMMGMNEEDITDAFPIGDKYKEIIANGMPDVPKTDDPMAVLDFPRLVRRVVLARAYEMSMVTKELNIQQAVVQAHQESMDFYLAA